MQLMYHGKAKESKVYVVSACGFDSIPAEFGVLHALQKFNGKSYLHSPWYEKKNIESIFVPLVSKWSGAFIISLHIVQNSVPFIVSADMKFNFWFIISFCSWSEISKCDYGVKYQNVMN